MLKAVALFRQQQARRRKRIHRTRSQGHKIDAPCAFADANMHACRLVGVRTFSEDVKTLAISLALYSGRVCTCEFGRMVTSGGVVFRHAVFGEAQACAKTRPVAFLGQAAQNYPLLFSL
ncbi:hypothetical protein RRG08_038028 [Elysia crispata]|uniref:Uncharacterized protein n=1 Tax=Elysia crispata TaxID=231223 RepID=A0AAE1DQ96_9GAST|nr:hypothetical protein RRG08_038028 [Elysia crispata]